jgi:hypothetical protein
MKIKILFLGMVLMLISCNYFKKNEEYLECKSKMNYWWNKAIASYDSIIKSKQIMIRDKFDGSYHSLFDYYQLFDETDKRSHIYADSAKIYIIKLNKIIKDRDSTKMIIPPKGSIFELNK